MGTQRARRDQDQSGIRTGDRRLTSDGALLGRRSPGGPSAGLEASPWKQKHLHTTSLGRRVTSKT